MIDLNSAVYGLERSAIREFSRLAKDRPGCIALTLGEPDFDTPECIRRQAEESLENHETHYIENNGIKALREKIALHETRGHGFPCKEDQVIVTSGATEALFVSLFGVLNPGDEVVIPSPAFVLYREIAKLCRAKAVTLDTEPEGFQVSYGSLSAVVTARTKAIVINSPNNPTGAVLNRQSLDAIRRVSLEHGVYVICDDVYRELVYGEDYHSFTEFPDTRDRTILVQSFSKPYAMTGWRMGYMVAPADVKERLELVHQFLVVSTPTPFQKAAMVALDTDVSPLRETYRRRRAYVLSRLEGMGLVHAPCDGAFYVLVSIKRFGLDSATFCRRMIDEALLASTPGICFGAEGYIRISYCYGDDVLKDGLDRLERFVGGL